MTKTFYTLYLRESERVVRKLNTCIAYELKRDNTYYLKKVNNSYYELPLKTDMLTQRDISVILNTLKSLGFKIDFEKEELTF